MEEAHRTGAPAMRPLFYSYPGDPAACAEETAYLYGPDLLVAPILHAGATEREVYLPAGETWVEQATGREYAGGQHIMAYAPLDVIPVFSRKGSGLQIEGLRS